MATDDPDPLACVLAVRAVPNARVSAFVEVMDDGETLRLRLAAPPVEGRANAELERFLTAALGLRRGDVQVVAGMRSRVKRVRLRGVTREQALAALEGGKAQS